MLTIVIEICPSARMLMMVMLPDRIGTVLLFLFRRADSCFVAGLADSTDIAIENEKRTVQYNRRICSLG